VQTLVMASELEKAFAKRRGRTEQVSESSATVPLPHASSAHSPDTTAAVEELPPWLEGINFSTPGAEPSAQQLPPWLQAAVECGVTFYDPDGNKVVVPSNKVGEFKTGLETVRNFERSWSGAAEANDACAPAHVPNQVETPAKFSTKDETHAPATPGNKSVNTAAMTDDEVQELQQQQQQQLQQGQRQVLKNAVQTRYFSLLRDGVEPNDAAARAIREATGQVAMGEESSLEKSAPNNSRASFQTCASGVKGHKQDEQCKANDEITVAA